MLSRLVVKNFKSIGEPGVDLELKPLTILVGPNGSGKSSILEAVAIAGQNFNPEGRPLSLPGFGELAHKPSGQKNVELSIYFPPDQAGSIPLLGIRWRNKKQPLKGDAESPAYTDQSDSLFEREVLNKTYLLSTTRGSINQSYAAHESTAQWVGKEGEGLVPLLAIIFGRRTHEGIARSIADWSSRFGLPDLRAGFWGNDQLGSDYKEPELNVVLPLFMSSAGTRQVLSIITQLCWGPKRGITIIEEPEISLHPESQLRLIELFAQTIKEEKQILITTHSPILLMALSHAVQQGQFEANDVAIDHVEKMKDSGTVAKRLPVSKKGYIEGWVPSFAKVERKLLREWVQSLPEA